MAKEAENPDVEMGHAAAAVETSAMTKPKPKPPKRQITLESIRSAEARKKAFDIYNGIAERAIDVSLLTANANQLRLLMHYNSKQHYPCIGLVITSLVLQVLVASSVIVIKSYKSKRMPWLERLKVTTSIIITIITVINILVASLVTMDHSSGSSHGGSSTGGQ